MRHPIAFRQILAILIVTLCVRAQSGQPVTKATVDQWIKELSNWCRWNNELGAVNLITPAKRKQAASLVREGISFSLARDAEKEKSIDNPSPFGHEMLRTGINNPGTSSGDRFTIAHHGYAH